MQMYFVDFDVRAQKLKLRLPHSYQTGFLFTSLSGKRMIHTGLYCVCMLILLLCSGIVAIISDLGAWRALILASINALELWLPS